MRWVLVAIVAVGSLYFMLKRRPADAYTIAFFSAVLYFLPGIVGFTLSPVTPASPVKLPMEVVPEAQAIMATVLGSILAFAALYDALIGSPKSHSWRLEDSALSTTIALGLSCVGVALAWYESDGAVFSPDKRVVIGAVGSGHVLWEMCASMAAVLAFAHRQWRLLLVATALLMLDVYVGFRFAFAISFVACAWLWLVDRGPGRLASLPARYLFFLFLGGVFIFSYQNLKEPIRNADWAEAGNRLANPLWYLQGVMTSEPFTTQTVLNEVVRNDFKSGTDHLWSATQHLFVFTPALGAEASRFNDQYQPALFPAVDHGLANNIWAQMWSAGGWPLLVAFVAVYVATLGLGSRLVAAGDPAIRGGAALFMAYWAFYIHRNELLVQVGLQKQMLLVWVLCVVAGIVMGRAFRTVRPAGLRR